MRKLNEATPTELKSEVEILCKHCGYDVDEQELEADHCSNCNKPLELKQSVTIFAPSVFSMQGEVT